MSEAQSAAPELVLGVQSLSGRHLGYAVLDRVRPGRAWGRMTIDDRLSLADAIVLARATALQLGVFRMRRSAHHCLVSVSSGMGACERRAQAHEYVDALQAARRGGAVHDRLHGRRAIARAELRARRRIGLAPRRDLRRARARRPRRDERDRGAPLSVSSGAGCRFRPGRARAAARLRRERRPGRPVRTSSCSAGRSRRSTSTRRVRCGPGCSSPSERRPPLRRSRRCFTTGTSRSCRTPSRSGGLFVAVDLSSRGAGDRVALRQAARTVHDRSAELLAGAAGSGAPLPAVVRTAASAEAGGQAR